MKISAVLKKGPERVKILLVTAPLLLFLPLYHHLYIALL